MYSQKYFGDIIMGSDNKKMVTDDIFSEIFNVKGFIKDTRISRNKLPDVILSERPIELQFVSFYEHEIGHRSAYGHRWYLDFDFHVSHGSYPIASKMHNHDFWEIIFVESGTLKIQIESAVYSLDEGDVCILNRATRHMEYFLQNQSLIYLTLSLEYINSWPIDSNVAFQRPMSHLLENRNNSPRYQNKDFILARAKNKDAYHSAINLIQSIKDELQENMPGSKYIVRGIIYRLITVFTLSKHYETKYHDLAQTGEFGLAGLVKEFLDTNKHRITLFELEGILQYSGAYINQLFKKKYFRSITEYNQDICLEYMAKLLLTTNKNIDEICHIIGFVNRTYVYRIFKEKFGCTPSEFRKNKSN